MISEDSALPPFGAPVNLRWNDRWVTAHVVRHRTGGLLDLAADGIPRAAILSVGHGPTGWMRIDEVDLDWKQRHANGARVRPGPATADRRGGRHRATRTRRPARPRRRSGPAYRRRSSVTVTPSRADSPGRRPQETSSVSRADGRAPGLAATTGAPDVPDAMIGLGERLLGRRDEIDGEQLEVDHADE